MQEYGCYSKSLASRSMNVTEPPFHPPPRREIPRDPWGMMQRVYGLRHSLLWPGQFAMMDLFKFATVWCLVVSLLAVIVRIFWRG